MDDKLRIKLTRKLVKYIERTPQGCWIWLRKTRHKGYAQITFPYRGKIRYTSPHRLAQVIFRNKYELLDHPELLVCHRCDNKDCINPDHMFIGTWLDNAMDDVLRNPRVSKEFEQKIVRMYQKEHNIRPCHDVRRHFYYRINAKSHPLLLQKRPRPNKI